MSANLLLAVITYVTAMAIMIWPPGYKVITQAPSAGRKVINGLLWLFWPITICGIMICRIGFLFSMIGKEIVWSWKEGKKEDPF